MMWLRPLHTPLYAIVVFPATRTQGRYQGFPFVK